MDYRWDDIRVFLALMRARTLSGAGALMKLDASTVSRRLTAFEEALGTTLFDRTRDGVAPTAAAEVLLPGAEEAERGANAVALLAEGLEAEVSGVVRLSVPPLVGERLLAPAMTRLRARHPALRLEIDANVAYAELTRREADIALRLKRPASGDLVAVRGAVSRYEALAAPALVEQVGVLERWSGVPWATWPESMEQLPSARWVREHVTPFEPFLRSNSLGAQLEVAREGLAAVLVARPLARLYGLTPLRFAERLRPDTASWPTEEIWIVGHRALRNVPRIASVWSFLLEELEKFPAPGT